MHVLRDMAVFQRALDAMSEGQTVPACMPADRLSFDHSVAAARDTAAPLQILDTIKAGVWPSCCSAPRQSAT